MDRFEESEWIIVTAAYKLSRFAPVPFEELYSVGCLAFSECISEYNESRGPFNAFLRRCVRNKIISFINEWKRQIPFYYSELLPEHAMTTPNDYDWEEKMQSVNRECRKMIRRILKFDFDGTLSQKKIRASLRDALVSEGWNLKDVYKTFNEIRQIL